MFYEFQQNNSGGEFLFDQFLTHFVLIEADSPEEANQIGEELGMYWHGVDAGRDCSCCGNRWYPQHKSDKGSTEPTVYGVAVDQLKEGDSFLEGEIFKWSPPGQAEIYVWRKGAEIPEEYVK